MYIISGMNVIRRWKASKVHVQQQDEQFPDCQRSDERRNKTGDSDIGILSRISRAAEMMFEMTLLIDKTCMAESE